ncbi:MAG: hypothetical protein ACJ8F7_08090 [Gemmataceae bacterium]
MIRYWHLLLVVGALGTTSEQRLGDAVGRVSLDRAELPLSGELTVVISVEGPAPVEVEPPRPLTQSPDWRVRPGKPKTTALPGGRERWEQSFRLEPFQAGKVALPLEPLRYRTKNELRDWSLGWPPLEVRVTSEVGEPDLGKARTVTGIDELPPEVKAQFPWVAVAGSAALLFLAGAAAATLALRRRATRPAHSPRDRAIDELLRLEAEIGSAPDVAQRLADLVRRYLEGRYDLAATRQTTAEFLTSLRGQNVISEEQAGRVAELLQRGDLAKFAGVIPSQDECVTLLAAARRLITETTPAGEV